jgi:hypothetical protein
MPTDEEMQQLTNIFAEMRHTTDRVAAISCGAWLDDMLSAAIGTRFIRMGKDWKERIFDAQTAPLNTFHGKIVIGYALGIFGPKTRADMDAIRWIRNQFAHRPDPITFDQPDVAKKCMGLRISRLPSLGGLHAPLDDRASPRDHYIAAAQRISGRLLIAARANHTGDRPKPPDALP